MKVGCGSGEDIEKHDSGEPSRTRRSESATSVGFVVAISPDGANEGRLNPR